MASLFTHLKESKRCWNDDGIRLLQKRLEKEDNRAKFIDLKSLLEESLCTVGFEKTYKLGSTTCEWGLKIDHWEPVVSLIFNPHDESIYFSINGKNRMLSDILFLWEHLRDSYRKGQNEK